jgi:hypothetical protein
LAERVGKRLYHTFYPKTEIGLNWPLEAVGGNWKYDQVLENAAENPSAMAELEPAVAETVGGDFAASLAGGAAITQTYLAQVEAQALKNPEGDFGHTAIAPLEQSLGDLTTEVVFTKDEEEVYKTVMAYAREYEKTHPGEKLTDEQLEAYLTTQEFSVTTQEEGQMLTVPDGPPVYVPGREVTKKFVLSHEEAQAALKRINLYTQQQQVRMILLVNPAEMGEELGKMVNYWVDEAPADAPNPFKDTAIMQRDEVQALHDKFADCFDQRGRLKEEKVSEFAAWILESRVNEKGQISREEGLTLKQRVEAIRQYKTGRAQQLVAYHLAVRRMFELVETGMEQGQIIPTEDDIKAGLVRQNAAGEWELNPESQFRQAWQKAGCGFTPEEAHLVVAQMVTEQDRKFGLADKAGNLNLENQYVSAAFTALFGAELAPAAERSGWFARVQAVALSPLQEAEQKLAAAEAEAKKWEDEVLRLRVLYLEMKVKGAETKAVEAQLTAAGQKWDAALQQNQEAQFEVYGFRLRILYLQSMWLKAKDPFDRKLAETQLLQLGSAPEQINEALLADAEPLLENLRQIDPQTNPEAFEKAVLDLMELLDTWRSA